MSPQSASRGPFERVYVDSIHCPDTEQLAASVGGLGRTSDDFVPSLEFQVGSCLYATAAVKAASRFGRAQGDHSGQSILRFIGTCHELSPPSSPFPSPFFVCFLGFPEWNTQDLPSLSLVCPWTIVRSWEHLPFSPLPLSPSLFLSFSLSSLFPLPWVSLDAFVIAGNPCPFFLWCVPGRLCRSWEHLLLLFFLLFLFLFSPYPFLPSGP